jgi:hypothetical protein
MGYVDEFGLRLSAHVNGTELSGFDIRVHDEGRQEDDAEPGNRRIPHDIPVVDAQGELRPDRHSSGNCFGWLAAATDARNL